MANVFSGITKRTKDWFGNKAQSIYDQLYGLFTSAKSFQVDEKAVLTITPAWRAISILSDILATMPIGLYEKTADGDVILAENHPLHKLISVSPHALYTPYEWRRAMVVNALLCGNGLSKIVRNGSGIPTAIELIPYDKIQDIQVGEDGQHLLYILTSGRSIHSDDIIHFAGLTYNGMGGINTTETHADTFATEAALRDYAKSFLEKGAFLSGAITVPQVLDERAYKRMKTSWDDAHGGAKKAGGTAILEAGSTFSPIQSTIKQSGYDLVKNSSIADISRIYGVPEYMIDGSHKPTYSSIEHISIDFKKYTIDGWCTKITQELTRKLVSANQAGKYFFEYDKSGLTSGDLQTMGEYYTKLFNIGVLNRDEIRLSLKKNKVADGDRYFVQGNNMIPVDAIDDVIELKKSKPTANGDTNVGADMQTIKE